MYVELHICVWDYSEANFLIIQIHITVKFLEKM